MRAATVVIAGLLSGCGCTHAPAADGSIADGGEADVRDARLDAREAGRDTGRDMTVNDLGRPDGGEPGGWVRVPGFSDSCAIERATDPEAGFGGPLSFVPCRSESRGSGCRELDFTWPDEGRPRFLAGLGFEAGYAPGRFQMWRRDGGTRIITAIADSSGRLIAAWRSPFSASSACVVMTIAMDRARYLLAASELPADRDVVVSVVVGGDLSQPPDTASPLLRMSNRELGSDGIVEAEVGEAFVAIGTSPRPLVLRVGWDGGVSTIGSAAVDGSGAFLGAIVGDALLYSSLGSRPAIRVSVDGAASQPLLTDVGGGVATTFATDGIDLAFMVAFGARDADLNYERMELWASPFSTNPDELRPRRLTGLALRRPGAQIAVAAGRVALLDDLDNLVIIRLSDGLRTDVPPRAGRVYSALSMLDENEVAVASRIPPVAPLEDHVFELLDLATLEAGREADSGP